MKKLFALFIMALFGWQGLMATEPVINANAPSMGIEFKVDFHTPRSNCTRYLGICSISFCLTVNFEDGGIGSGEVPCQIQLTRNNELLIQLNESNISRYDPGLLKFLAGKSEVTFDETYDITQEVSKGLPIKGSVIIRPGSYKLTCQNGVYTLIIPL